MIELKNVTKIYKSKKNLPTKVLDDVNLKVGNNGMIFIVGKSGSGKSTLLNLLGGLDSVTSGDIIIDNKKMSRFKTSDYDSYRNNYVGFIFQDYNNLDELTVLENITLGYKLQGKKIDNEKVDNLIKELDIYDLKNRKMNELSGGEKQRVAIARALFKDSKIILADEPTGNLDSKNAKNIMEILKKISNEKLVIVVTHDIEFAKIYADKIITIQDGNVIQDREKQSEETEGIYESKKTKLPLKDILKLSILPLKNKKARLFLTSLLIAFTTMFLSIFYCIISYNPNGKHLSLINDKNETFLEINKYQKIDKFTSKTVPLSNEEINKIKSSLNIKSYPSYIVNNYSRYIKFWGLNIYEPEDMFNDAPAIEEDMYTTSIGTLQIINDEYLKDNKLDLIGNYTKNKNEIIISNYLADLIITYGIYEYKTENLYQPSNYEQIVNDKKKIKFGENYVIISGIVNYDLKKYQVLKNKYASKNNDSAIAKLHNEHALLNAYNIYNKVFTNSNFIEMLKETNPKDYIDFNGLLLGNINAKEIKELIKKYPLEEKYSLNTKYSDTIRNYNKHLNFFKPIVNVIILIFTIFSILLISNFTLNSIKTRKKSIGILRALGITQKDVFKIFIFEFIILSFISTIISGTLSYFLFILLRNTTFSIDYEILNPFHLNYQLILFIYLYTILVIIISSIIPLFKFITKPPIDVIKDKK